MKMKSIRIFEDDHERIVKIKNETKIPVVHLIKKMINKWLDKNKGVK